MARPGRPIRPPMDEQLTMAPLPCSRIWRSSYFMQFQTPRRLIAFTRSNSSPLASAVSTAGDCTPALLYAASRRPKVETVCSDHGCHVSLLSDIAADSNRHLSSGDQFFCGLANRLLVDICQHH